MTMKDLLSIVDKGSYVTVYETNKSNPHEADIYGNNAYTLVHQSTADDVPSNLNYRNVTLIHPSEGQNMPYLVVFIKP